jgi:hypothetical protein
VKTSDQGKVGVTIVNDPVRGVWLKGRNTIEDDNVTHFALVR